MADVVPLSLSISLLINVVRAYTSDKRLKFFSLLYCCIDSNYLLLNIGLKYVVYLKIYDFLFWKYQTEMLGYNGKKSIVHVVYCYTVY